MYLYQKVPTRGAGCGGIPKGQTMRHRFPRGVGLHLMSAFGKTRHVLGGAHVAWSGCPRYASLLRHAWRADVARSGNMAAKTS